MYSNQKKENILLLLTLILFILINVIGDFFFPYEMLFDVIVDNQTNYFWNQNLMMISGFGILLWIFYTGFVFGKRLGWKQNEESI